MSESEKDLIKLAHERLSCEFLLLLEELKELGKNICIVSMLIIMLIILILILI